MSGVGEFQRILPTHMQSWKSLLYVSITKTLLFCRVAQNKPEYLTFQRVQQNFQCIMLITQVLVRRRMLRRITNVYLSILQ